MSIEEIEKQLDKRYRSKVTPSWIYKVTCLNPVVITAFATPYNNVRQDVVPFHVCDYNAWCSGVFDGKVTGEFEHGTCSNCGLEYKLAAVIANIGKAAL